ncbi:hypothetical protein [Rubritalea marina]|uniref:hypothetical protein n=1 Tax=Rubritalea marina TaxID=361055 RepID=UPI00036542AE|nr:hypothetical protein [Rubritalea marina]
MRLLPILSFIALPLTLSQCEQSTKTDTTETSKKPSLPQSSDNSLIEADADYIEFPHRAILSNNKGKSLEVNILGRSKDTVTFSKVGSSQINEYPITELSDESVELVERFPVIKYRPTTDASYEDKRISFLEKKCAELEADMERYARGSFKYKSISKKLAATEAEISDLKK